MADGGGLLLTWIVFYFPETVNYMPIITRLSNETLVAGSNKTFNCVVHSSLHLHIEWFHRLCIQGSTCSNETTKCKVTVACISVVDLSTNL